MSDTTFDLTEPQTFNLWADDVVRFGDMDATGHVNNVSFARYVESGRVGFMRSDQMPPYTERQRFIVGHFAIRYLAQAFWPAKVRIGSRVVRLGRTSMTLGHGVFVNGTCSATAETTMVFIIDGRPAPIPGETRALLEGLMAKPGSNAA